MCMLQFLQGSPSKPGALKWYPVIAIQTIRHPFVDRGHLKDRFIPSFTVCCDLDCINRISFPCQECPDKLLPKMAFLLRCVKMCDLLLKF